MMVILSYKDVEKEVAVMPHPDGPTADSPTEHTKVRGLPPAFGTHLDGAIDLHVHGQPDLSTAFQNRGDDLEVASLAADYGMSGWVLKSHLWPTMDRANLLHSALRDRGFSVWGSVTLNPPVGGVEAGVVELAAAHDAKVVFLPTWGASADAARDGYISMLLRRIAPHFDDYVSRSSIELLAPDGSLHGRTREVIDACRDLDLSLATGHAGLEESRAVVDYCAQIGQRVLVTHPMHYISSPTELEFFTERGALVELNNAPLLHPDGHHSIRDVHETLSAVGPDKVVLTTDIFSRWVPPEPECFRMFLEQLSYLGWSAEDLATMVVRNPRRFLGAPDVSTGSDPEGAS
jgi:sugar phosphate isomerase/epimerase